MRSRKATWLSGLGVAVLVGGLVLANYGSGVTPAAAHPDDDKKGNPLTKILQKLDQVLAAIAGIGGGGDGHHTLRWDQKLPAATRFVVLLDWSSQAVLDRETGLVWEHAPATTTHTWSDARFQCMSRTTGGRKGWRLPSVHELASLIDPSVTPGPTLPAGHPFTNVQSAFYWSASSNAVLPTHAWNVNFSVGDVLALDKSSSNHAWCVRGGHNDGSEY